MTAADGEQVTIKLVIAIVQDEDADALADSLIAEKYRLTRINTAGGLLRQGNVSFLLGVEEEQAGSATFHHSQELRYANAVRQSASADHGAGRVLYAVSGRGPGRRRDGVRLRRGAFRAALDGRALRDSSGWGLGCYGERSESNVKP